MQWLSFQFRALSSFVLVLLLAGAFYVPGVVWAEEPDPLVIPVTASDSTFEEGVLVTWPQAGTDSVFYRVYRDCDTSHLCRHGLLLADLLSKDFIGRFSFM
jgi:hypothetical protein